MIGFLGTTHQDPRHAYRSDEIALATAVGTLVALMLEHDRALRERAEARASVLALHEANRRMDEFLSLASHELRTPMTVAKGNLQLTVLHVQKALREGALLGHDPQSVTTLLQMLERADHHMGRLSRLVDDLVDVSRILADKLELRVTFCDLGNLVSEVVQGQRLIAAPRPIHLTLPAGTPVRILADAGRIEQVLTNYLTNALKYSPATSPIHVGLSVDDTSARVWVRDEGPGLAPEEQDRIWGRFYQVAGVTSYISAHVGLGLGLHISRTIIEQHHGQVGVESTRGHGATFWFTLPLYTAKAA